MAKKFFSDNQVTYGGGLKPSAGYTMALYKDKRSTGGILNTIANTVSDWLSLSDGGDALTGILVQGMNMQANRPLTVAYDLTSTDAYFICGRTQVNGGLQRLCGPKGIIGKFYEMISDPCGTGNNLWFQFNNGCGTKYAEGHYDKLIMRFCLLENIQFAANAQDYVISENNQIRALDIEMDSGTTTGVWA
jgi:hypothetical protein